jgi:hypothetical protein
MPPRATKSGYDGARMIYVIALLAGLLGAGLGAALGLGLGLALASLLNISSFEGAAGYFVVSIAIIGALIGLPAGIVIALRRKGSRGFAATGGRTLAVLGIIGALVAAGIGYRLSTVEHFPGGGNPAMEFEIRLPAGMAAPERSKVDFEMQAGSQRSGGLFKDNWMRRDDDRVVLSGLVPLYTRTSSRILVVTLPGQPKLLFQIGLSATPKPSTDYGAWQRVTYLDEMKQDSQPRKPKANETFEIRLKVPPRD